MRKVATVIGSSGIGKSKLAVELCKVFQGQVINADALQVYKGLDIITNKMPLHEREGVKHHLMDFLEPDQEYKVTEFLNDAMGMIETISNEKQLPVVVGGTHYYIQSLLWNNTLIGDSKREKSPLLDSFPELDKMETTELYKELSKIDPVMANKWHPSDRRKILRSLKIHHQTGQLQSDIIKSQQENIETEGLKPRYKSLIFWIYSDSVNLNPRLDKRVDQMIDTGLFEEIKDLRQRVVQGRVTIPGYEMEKYQRGLWQAIGYKEFDPYFNELEAGKSDAELEKIKKDCTERMKAATRRYAKRQVQWIRNKLLPTVYHSDNDDVMVYLLDANDIDTWNINVRDKAIEIARAFQSDSTMPDPFTINDIAATILSKSKDAMDTQTRVLSWKKYTCDVCKDDKGEVLVLNGDKEWEQHKKSRYHRKYIKHLRVEEMRKAYMNSKKVEAKIRALSVLQIE